MEERIELEEQIRAQIRTLAEQTQTIAGHLGTIDEQKALIAQLQRLIVDRMWARMKQGNYLQIDETPVRVLDPEVKGKAAKGYLWFFGVPGGDVILVFDSRRSYKVLDEQLGGFAGFFRAMPMMCMRC